MAGTSFKQRRGTAQLWSTTNPVLADGEIGYVKDTGVLKVGDGVTAWNSLPAAFGSTYLPILGKAADSDKLDGRDSTEFLLTSDAAATYLKSTDAASTYVRGDAAVVAPTANAVVRRDAQGSAQFQEVSVNNQTSAGSAARKDYVDKFVTPTGASRSLVNHFGTLAAYPAAGSGVKLGDRCYRSDLFCEMVYNGTSWVQVHAARSTSANRTAMTAGTLTAVHAGFEFVETDTYRKYVYSSAANWLYAGGGAPPLTNVTWGNTAIATDFDTTNFGRVKYGPDASGRVILQGLMKSVVTINTYPTGLFILPIGFRPAVTELFHIIQTAGTATTTVRIDVLSNGVVNVMGGTLPAGGFTPLDGIAFWPANN